MKKTFSIILILGFLFNIIGYQLLFLSLQYKIHFEIKLRIEEEPNEEELTLIVPESDEDIHWTRHNKEFKYKNEM